MMQTSRRQVISKFFELYDAIYVLPLNSDILSMLGIKKDDLLQREFVIVLDNDDKVIIESRFPSRDQRPSNSPRIRGDVNE